MPWSRGPVDDRLALIRLYESGEFTMTELSERVGVTRSCAYKWIRRYERLGEAGLEELSRAPHKSPQRKPAELVEALLRLKSEHPTFGPVTLSDMMVDREGVRAMSASTAGEILKRHGLVKPQRRRRRVLSGSGEKPVKIPGPGHTMTADFKGQARLGDGSLCYGLTILDPGSRYLMAIEALKGPEDKAARKVFERVFREFGVPDQLLTDNGVPFCNRRTLGGLTRLAKWWIDLGSTPVRIALGRPQQNGTHERMHRTLGEAAMTPPRENRRAQQQAFDRFRYEYDLLRPHRSIGRRPPASLLTTYRIPFSSRIRPYDYPDFLAVRRVRPNGMIKWMGDHFFVTEVLAGEFVALEQVADNEWDIWYRHVVIGTFDGQRRKIVPAAQRSPKVKSSSE